MIKMPEMEQIAAPRPAPARWSAEEEERLAAGLKAGMELKALAAAHGRSVGALQSRAQLMGLYDYSPYNDLMHDSAVADDDHATRGTPWTEPEIANLLTTFATRSQSPTPADDLKGLAQELGRSPRALVLKLVHLGALNPPLAETPLRSKPLPMAKPAKPKPVAAPTENKATQKITITAEFQTALAELKRGENLLVLGKAGTGKSTFLRWIRLQLNERKPVLLAPTGMAALQVGGQTIHSFFGLKPRLMQGTADDWHKPRNPKIFSQLKLLIIDEVSMVRADILDAVDRFLKIYGPHPRRTFGGVQILLVGDVGQLPPVVRREEAEDYYGAYSTPFFFSSHAWVAGNFGTVPFTQVFRQADADFIALLNAVRVGRPTPAQLAMLNARVSPTTPEGAVILAARNATVERINRVELDKLRTPATAYEAIRKGNMDEAALTTPASLELKVGAHVMFTRNDPQGRWVNGSLGTVVKLHATAVDVRVQASASQPEALHRVEPATWEATRFRLGEDNEPVAEVAGSFTQLPLTLAWALTIHKAQGQTLSNVQLDLGDGGTFAEGQLYVALSRAVGLEALHLTQPVEPRHIKTHPAVMEFLAESPL